MGFNIRMFRAWLPLIVVAVIVLLLPIAGASQDWLLFIFLFFTYLAMANMWNLLAGYSGLISLCQPAFVGLGAYAVALLTWIGVPLYIGIVAGAIVAGLFAVLISIPVFRMKGMYFAIGTLIVPEVLRIVFLLWRPVGGAVVGGGAGYAIKGATDVSQTQIYWLASVVYYKCLYSSVIPELDLASMFIPLDSSLRWNDINILDASRYIRDTTLVSLVLLPSSLCVLSCAPSWEWVSPPSVITMAPPPALE